MLLPILEREPAVQAVTLLRHLQMADPGAFPDDRIRRTLERRVRDWRALHGAARDVIFRQTPEPGRMALSDFTDAAELGVTIAGAPFPHRLFHFVMAYSGWEHAAVVLGGMGTVVGVLVGATILKLLPEKLREVNDYRLLVFGLLLVVMMRFRPEGLIANKRRQLEFHEDDQELAKRIEEIHLEEEEATA